MKNAGLQTKMDFSAVAHHYNHVLKMVLDKHTSVIMDGCDADQNSPLNVLIIAIKKHLIENGVVVVVVVPFKEDTTANSKTFSSSSCLLDHTPTYLVKQD